MHRRATNQNSSSRPPRSSFFCAVDCCIVCHPCPPGSVLIARIFLRIPPPSSPFDILHVGAHPSWTPSTRSYPCPAAPRSRGPTIGRRAFPRRSVRRPPTLRGRLVGPRVAVARPAPSDLGARGAEASEWAPPPPAVSRVASVRIAAVHVRSPSSRSPPISATTGVASAAVPPPRGVVHPLSPIPPPGSRSRGVGGVLSTPDPSPSPDDRPSRGRAGDLARNPKAIPGTPRSHERTPGHDSSGGHCLGEGGHADGTVRQPSVSAFHGDGVNRRTRGRTSRSKRRGEGRTKPRWTFRYSLEILGPPG